MPNKFQVNRRVNGAVATPSTAGRVEGEMSVNMPLAAGVGTKAYIYFYDGTAWRTANPDVTISTQSVALGAAGADIGAAYTTWSGTPGNSITGNVVIATWGNPAQAYVLTNTAAPQTAASWTSLGGAVSFAIAADAAAGVDLVKALNSGVLRTELTRLLGTAADLTKQVTTATSTGAGSANLIPLLDAAGKLDMTLIPLVAATQPEAHAGTSSAVFITPASLRGEALEAPSAGTASAADHDKLVMLDGNGQIDLGFLKAVPSAVRGTIDATAAPPAAPTGGAYKSGDMLFANKAGAIDAGWTGATGNIKSGDMLLYDGANWHVLPNETDLNAYVPLAGTALMAGSIGWAADQAGNTVLDAKNGDIIDAHIDCGTY